MSEAKIVLERRLRECQNNLAQSKTHLANACKMVEDNEKHVRDWERSIEEIKAALVAIAQDMTPFVGASAIEYYRKHPVEWVEKLLDIRLNPYQRDVLTNTLENKNG